MIQKEKIAIIAITKHGAELAEMLGSRLQKSMVYISKKFGKEKLPLGSGVQYFETPIKDLTAQIFNTHDALVYIVSLGAVVRTIAPFLKDKHTDPAVIVVDDKANFAISVLSGHVGGANELTEEIAEILGATAVITTASDVGKTIPVDILGREFGWTTELNENITKVSASVVNEESVGIFQDAGEKNWWKKDFPLPKNFKFYLKLEELSGSDCKAALIITDRDLEKVQSDLLKKSVIYRPKSLAIGMGCDKGVSQEDLDELLSNTFKKNGLSVSSIKNVSTVDLKNREAGLLAFCQRHGWDLICYTREELAQLKDILPNPSEMVMKYLKIPGVSEPAAMLTARTDALVVEKTKGKMSTLAVARIRFESPLTLTLSPQAKGDQPGELENVWKEVCAFDGKGERNFKLAECKVQIYKGAMDIPLAVFYPEKTTDLANNCMAEFSQVLSNLGLELDCVEDGANYKINRRDTKEYVGRATKQSLKLHTQRIQDLGWESFRKIAGFYLSVTNGKEKNHGS